MCDFLPAKQLVVGSIVKALCKKWGSLKNKSKGFAWLLIFYLCQMVHGSIGLRSLPHMWSEGLSHLLILDLLKCLFQLDNLAR